MKKSMEMTATRVGKIASKCLLLFVVVVVDCWIRFRLYFELFVVSYLDHI